MPRPSEKGTAKRPEKNTTAGSKRTYLLSLPHLPTIVTRSTAVERACGFGQAHVCALAPAGDAGALPPHPRDFLSHGSDASMCGDRGRRLFSFSAQSQKPKTIGKTGCATERRTTRWKQHKPSPRRGSPPRGRESQAHRRTLDLAIAQRVASQRCPPPFHQACTRIRLSAAVLNCLGSQPNRI